MRVRGVWCAVLRCTVLRCAVLRCAVFVVWSLSGCTGRGVHRSHDLGEFARPTGLQSGIVPESLASPMQRGGDEPAARLRGEAVRASQGEGARPLTAEQMPTQRESSPLNRALAACPAIEQELTAALTTTELGERTKRYEALTERCRTSSDLWVWLGNDYRKLGRAESAKRCYRRALALEPERSDLRKLTDEPAPPPSRAPSPVVR